MSAITTAPAPGVRLGYGRPGGCPGLPCTIGKHAEVFADSVRMTADAPDLGWDGSRRRVASVAGGLPRVRPVAASIQRKLSNVTYAANRLKEM
jgi:hypothetical protein